MAVELKGRKDEMMNEQFIYAEIDLSALTHNVKVLRSLISPETRFLVAVKANGYGHGAVEVARTALNAGADWLGVARLGEALSLRRQGIKAPILIFGPVSAEDVLYLLEYDLRATVCTQENARQLARAAQMLGKTLPVHIKVDTGMGRLGLLADELFLKATEKTANEIEAISTCKGLTLEGIYTHFASSDAEDKTYAKQQFSLFQNLLKNLNTAGVRIPIRHAANSAAIIDIPETHLDMVRAGIAVYGLYPSADVDRSHIDLKPVLSLKTKVLHVKRVLAGTRIGYGSTYMTSSGTSIATVAAGYGDGYNRRLSNSCGAMLVQGRRVPVVGKICMDLSMVDVGWDSGVDVGDEVVLIGHQGQESLSAEDLASMLGTINYEVVTTLTDRVERIYIKP
jgi:alanine racemase